jgi:antitoxin (DNA-binding transcriptional repressor) of toxin-antitoxin stability system
MATPTYTANEAKTRFGEFIDRVQQGPVQVTRHDRVVAEHHVAHGRARGCAGPDARRFGQAAGR